MHYSSNNIFSKKLKAGSLFYALIVTLLVGIISTAMITLTFSSRFLEQKDELEERLTRNVHSGIQLLIAEKNSAVDPFTLDLFGEALDSVFLEKKEWGLFSVGLSSAFQQSSTKKNVIHQVVQFGLIPNQQTQAAIYLEDNDKPMIINGNTYIKGNAYLPKAGVKEGAMKGFGYSGRKLVDGVIKTSKNKLPLINKKKIQYLLEQFQRSSNQVMEDSIEQSFYEETKIIGDDILILDHQTLKRNVVLNADSLIYVGRNATLEDVLIFAPYIFIEDGFKGNIQAFATRLLDVGENVHLKYPSVLGLIKNKNHPEEPKMMIESNSEINGLVFIHNNYNNKKYPKLKIQKDALIKGQVFAECSVELYGDIYGNISCKSFFLRHGSSSYVNHLLDVEINTSKLSAAYLSPMLTVDKNSEVGIVKYLK